MPGLRGTVLQRQRRKGWPAAVSIITNLFPRGRPMAERLAFRLSTKRLKKFKTKKKKKNVATYSYGEKRKVREKKKPARDRVDKLPPRRDGRLAICKNGKTRGGKTKGTTQNLLVKAG